MKSDLAPMRRLFRLVVALAVVGCVLPISNAAAAPLANPASLGFGQEVVGRTSSPQTVQVENSELIAVELGSVSVVGSDPADFSIVGEDCAGTTVAPGVDCQVEVAFSPQAGGARNATLEIAVEGEAPIDVPLSGSGQTMRLTVPGSAGFPTTSVGGVGYEQVLLKNSSEAGVNVNEVGIEGADPGDFGIEGTNCAGFIGPSMSCTITLRFSPAASGLREARLRIATDGAPAEYLVELNGQAAAPELAFEPSGHDFGLVEAHSGSPRTNFTLRNVGSATVSLSNLGVSGPGSNEFFIANSNCFGATLSPGATCGIEVQFNANQEGSFAAALEVSAGGTTFQAPLSARAERPKVTASPTPFAFAATSVGSRQVQEMTLTNTGNLPVAFFIALVSGGDIGSFHLVGENCTSNVFAGTPRVFEPGESCTAKVAFEPTSPGTKSATLSFFGGGEGALQVTVEGTAVAPLLSLSPTSRDFGAVSVGTAGPVQTFELRNESVEPQTIESASIAGADLGEFQIRSDSCSGAVLDPGAGCAVAVRFAPGATGPKVATLRIHGGGGTSVAQLSGEGTAISTAATPDPIVPQSTKPGRVALTVNLRARPAGGKVTVGQARCESSQPCVINTSGLVTGRLTNAPGQRPATRGIGASKLKLAPGATAPLKIALPSDFRKAPAGAQLRLSLNWQTGPARGASNRSVTLGSDQ
jgi:hypothetical protein